MVETKVNGSAIIRKGTQDYKQWQFVLSDGVTAVDLSAATKVIMRIKNEAAGTSVEYKTDDGSPILYMLDPKTDGKVELRPAADTFDTVGKFIFHFIIVDSVGNKPIPEHRNEVLEVIDDYPVS